MLSRSRTWWGLLAVAFVALAPATALAEEAEDYAPYVRFDDPLREMQATIKRAKKYDKLALVVLGANWCHDSKALAKRLEADALRSVLGEHYETLVMGVGYYEQGFDVAQRLGVEVYTHTPTVLIYEPKSETLVNLDDHHIWRDAALLSDEETLIYFQEKADAAKWSVALTLADDEQIKAFERQQAERLRKAYSILGPKLEARSDDLDELWGPVRDLRYSLADDLKRLREEQREAKAKGEPFDPEWPAYEPFPWEADD
ncbi:MAG: hypothetical protein HRU11_03310 [Parvularculaceae bacterium]|nr:hypothetical protein [Parvularculaceae bacterium]